MGKDRSMFSDLTRKGAMKIIYITGAHGSARYTDLQTHLTVSDPTIGKRLNELVEANLLVRTFDEELAPRVDYSLSAKAEEVYEPLAKLFDWASERAETDQKPNTESSTHEQARTCVCCRTSSESGTSRDRDDVDWFHTVHGLIEVISKTYAMRTISYLREEEPARYSELRDWLEATSNTALSTRLDELEEAGLLTRRSYDEVPPHVEYSLTQDGHELADRVEPVLEWAEQTEA